MKKLHAIPCCLFQYFLTVIIFIHLLNKQPHPHKYFFVSQAYSKSGCDIKLKHIDNIQHVLVLLINLTFKKENKLNLCYSVIFQTSQKFILGFNPRTKYLPTKNIRSEYLKNKIWICNIETENCTIKRVTTKHLLLFLIQNLFLVVVVGMKTDTNSEYKRNLRTCIKL